MSETVSRDEYFEYLTDLQDSGITNMFGAAPYLASEFDLTIKEARSIVAEWMKSFGKETGQ